MFPDGLLQRVLEREMERTGKADRAQDAQSILLQALCGTSDTADDAVSQILFSVKRVDDAEVRMHRHRVDGEIAAAEILQKIGGEADSVGTAVIVIAGFDAVGGHFDRLIVHDQRQRAMLDPGRDDPASPGEQCDHLFRPGICGDIVIMHRKVEQSVTDTSADEERFMMMFIQDAQHLAHRHRDIVEVSHADII